MVRLFLVYMACLIGILGAVGCNYKNVKSQDPNQIAEFAPSFVALQSKVLLPKCQTCHSGNNAAGGVDVSSYASMFRSQSFIVPFNPEASNLYTWVALGKMPKNSAPLSKREVEAIYKWIKSGAKETEDGAPAPTPPPTPVVQASYASIQEDLLNRKCVSCHSGEKPPKNLRFEKYTDLVNTTLFPQMVVPGHPFKSDVFNEIFSGDMPDKAPPLSQPEIFAVYTWIMKGAKEHEEPPPAQ